MPVLRTIFASALAAALVVPSVARANGRFPEANHVYLSPTDPNEIIVRVSFGLLVSRDGGKRFDWVCEQAVSVTGIEDPTYAYTKSGGIVGSTFEGVILTADRCAWPKVESLAKKVFIDLTNRAAERDRIVAFESSYDKDASDGGVAFFSQLYESIDDGRSFAPLGQKMDPALLGYTVDLAPSDPKRIYVSATRDPGSKRVGALLVSTDGAATWQERVVPMEGPERAPYIAAVDPKNPDRVYVRVSSTPIDPGRLLLSDDAGATFRTIFRGKGPLLGFALNEDGSKIYVGGPQDGLNVASTTDFAFRQTSTVEVQCITAAADRLWVCSMETSGFIAAWTRDEGASFEGKTHFVDIPGPLACPATPPFDQCVQNWPMMRNAIGFVQDSGLPSTITVPPASSASNDGCGCSTPGINASAAGGTLAALLSCGIFVVRRRRNGS